MSDIRREFYDAINRANNTPTKKTPVKKPILEKVSVEEQIQQIINESKLAVTKIEITVNNQSLVDYLYEMTKKSQDQLELERKINEEIETINKLREEARKKYNRFNRINEFSSFNPSSSSSVGSGGGRLIISVDSTTNSYVVDDYVENYLE